MCLVKPRLLTQASNGFASLGLLTKKGAKNNKIPLTQASNGFASLGLSDGGDMGVAVRIALFILLFSSSPETRAAARSIGSLKIRGANRPLFFFGIFFFVPLIFSPIAATRASQQAATSLRVKTKKTKTTKQN